MIIFLINKFVIPSKEKEGDLRSLPTTISDSTLKKWTIKNQKRQQRKLNQMEFQKEEEGDLEGLKIKSQSRYISQSPALNQIKVGRIHNRAN